MNLKNIKKVPYEIGQILSKNAKICALLVNDTTTPENLLYPFEKLLSEGYITFCPPIYDGSVVEYTRNTNLIILLDNVNNSVDNNTRGSGSIYVITDLEHLMLTNYRNRLLELADEITNTLTNVKLTSASQVQVTNITYVTISTTKVGYRISFNLNDQQIRKAEI